MENLLTFDEFVNENYETQPEGFDPSMSSNVPVKGLPIDSIDDLVPGKNYILYLEEETVDNMIYQGLTNGSYIFNSENQEDSLRFDDNQIRELIEDGSIRENK